MLTFHVQGFKTQKEGNAPEECMDAFAHSRKNGVTQIVVVDGATESIFGVDWAEQLAASFANNGKDHWSKKYTSWQTRQFNKCRLIATKKWLDEIGPRIVRQSTRRRVDEDGGKATICVLTINARLQKWQCLAVGDTNLFVVTETVTAFPITDAGGFGFSPQAVGTLRNVRRENLQFTSGQLSTDVGFIIATDAFAELLVKFRDRGAKPQEIFDFCNFADQETFEAQVAKLRNRNLIKNDDVTVVTVTVKEE